MTLISFISCCRKEKKYNVERHRALHSTVQKKDSHKARNQDMDSSMVSLPRNNLHVFYFKNIFHNKQLYITGVCSGSLNINPIQQGQLSSECQRTLN